MKTMTPFRIGSAVLLCIFSLGGGASLRADDGNYQNYIIGERASGMGGAVAASSEDLDGVYYNPAGLAGIDANRLSLSTNLYGFFKLEVTDGLGPGKDYKIREFEAIPTAFGSILNVSEILTLAFSVLVPDNVKYNHQQTYTRLPTPDYLLFQSEYFSYSIDDQTLWIGPSLGVRLGEDWSIGASAFLVYRSMVNKQDWSYLITRGDYEKVSVSTRHYDLDYSSYGVLALLGARWDATDRLSLALVVQPPSVHISGDGEFTYTSNFDRPDDRIVHAPDLDVNNKIPAKVVLGAAWHREKEYCLGLDLSYHLPTSFILLEGDDDWSGGEISRRVRRRSVFNVNLGGEYYAASGYPLRAGFFTNLSSAHHPDPSLPGSPEKIDMYGVTASVGSESEHTTINVGVNYVWGSGKTLGVSDNLDYSVVDVRESYLFLFLSSTYIF